MPTCCSAALRRIGLAYTQFAPASCGRFRRKLLKIGALARISVRRIRGAMASVCPCQMVLSMLVAIYLYGSLADTMEKLKKMIARYEKRAIRKFNSD